MIRDKLIVDQDLEVTIKSLSQAQTYGGLLEGAPSEAMNKQIIDRVMDKAQQLGYGAPVYLIKPNTKKLLGQENNLIGKAIALPDVYCIAELSYPNTFKDPAKDFSTLMLVWFQSDYAFPIQEHILTEITQLPYRKLCGEFEY